MTCRTLTPKITKLCDSSPDFLFPIYQHQAIDLTESKIQNPSPPKSKTT